MGPNGLTRPKYMTLSGSLQRRPNRRGKANARALGTTNQGMSHVPQPMKNRSADGAWIALGLTALACASLAALAFFDSSSTAEPAPSLPASRLVADAPTATPTIDS